MGTTQPRTGTRAYAQASPNPTGWQLPYRRLAMTGNLGRLGPYDAAHMRFWARKCSVCGLRFPVERESLLGVACPHCEAKTKVVHDGYQTHEIARTPAGGVHLEVLLDNVRSLRNVGSIFRTADGAGVAALHLCGFTATPDNPRLAKTALGAEHAVPWSHGGDAAERVAALRSAGSRIWALEGGPESVPLFEALGAIDPEAPLCLVVGHEVSGVDPRVQASCHKRVHLPMHGTKGSLNVGVAFGIAAYLIRYAAQRPAGGPAR